MVGVSDSFNRAKLLSYLGVQTRQNTEPALKDLPRKSKGRSRPKEEVMLSRLCGLSLVLLLAVGCNNTLNPLCGSARPVPVIGSLSPSTISFAQVQNGFVLTINGSNFVSASEVLVDGKPLSTTVTSSQQLNVNLTTGVIAGPGDVNVSVKTPSGSSGDVGCSSGGTSSMLVLKVT